MPLMREEKLRGRSKTILQRTETVMAEIWEMLRDRKFRTLFLEPSDNVFLQMFRYLFVGGAAFVVDTGLYALFIFWGAGIFISGTIGFLAGLIANYFLAKRLVFKRESARVRPVWEFVSYGIIGLFGLLFTLGLLYFFSKILGVHEVIAKFPTAVIVLAWNFFARKILLYRSAEK